MQKQQIRLLILIIIILLVICFILVRADYKMHEIDRQMPEIGSSSSQVWMGKMSGSTITL
ncbi:MAG TPA: hypothetical protein VFG10_14260 [Saprospiraceae bacterium]|nr:hypothetical protein [Saprospiraceae bacterium]